METDHAWLLEFLGDAIDTEFSDRNKFIMDLTQNTNLNEMSNCRSEDLLTITIADRHFDTNCELNVLWAQLSQYVADLRANGCQNFRGFFCESREDGKWIWYFF